MRHHRLLSALIVVAAGAVGWACDGNSITTSDHGTVRVKMTDAPFPADSVDSVNVFVTRVDMRASAADSAAADSAVATDSASAHGWTTVATPNHVYNLIELQNGTSVDLGTTQVATGHYSGMRLVIDPSRSRVVLKNGTVLDGNSSPGVSFPSGSSSGLKITTTGGFDVTANDTTTLMLDFDLDQSFVVRGNTILQLGLLFKPVIVATVVAN
jgi:hypothetical protein